MHDGIRISLKMIQDAWVFDEGRMDELIRIS